MIVKPDNPNGKWIVRPSFIGAFPYVDDSLLKRGYHVGFYDVTHEYGNIKAQKDFESYIKYCRKKYKLNYKFIIEGFSRGGFFALCYSINHPDDIEKIYVDAPVCNLRSWPLLSADSLLYKDAVRLWRDCGVDIDNVFDFPIRNFDTIVSHNIPCVLVYGDKDTIVPYKDNFGEIKKYPKRFLKIRKPFSGHHPHSMPKCKKIVDFLSK